jgi:ubiquinone/menaquinone biosynthesis C-methylase UbiE
MTCAKSLQEEPSLECAANERCKFAALMENRGRVLAFDKDPQRLKRLRSNAAAAGATCISARLADFLQLPLFSAQEFRCAACPTSRRAPAKHTEQLNIF